MSELTKAAVRGASHITHLCTVASETGHTCLMVARGTVWIIVQVFHVVVIHIELLDYGVCCGCGIIPV